jgi:hypothetical protein
VGMFMINLCTKFYCLVLVVYYYHQNKGDRKFLHGNCVVTSQSEKVMFRTIAYFMDVMFDVILSSQAYVSAMLL